MLASPAAVEERMKQLCLGERGHALGRMVWEHVSAGGKRLRARLALAALSALGGRAEDGVAWAAACELLHNASLIHDDIQDGDRYRRKREALWVRHGVAQAINAGDLCITLSLHALASGPFSDAQRWQLTHVLASAARAMTEGQSAEMRLLSAGAPTWDEYEKCAQGKTSALFTLPIEGAALIAGRSPERAGGIAAACRPVGVLFQIQDDILDLFGDNGREMRGTDLAQAGKPTALVVDHLRLHPEDREWLLGILSAPRERTPREAIDQAIERFRRGGALAAVWGRIDAIRRDLRASEALRREPELHALVERVVPEVLRSIEHTRPAEGT